jgi:hypothetical protein
MSYDEWRFTFGVKTKKEISEITKSYLKEGLSVWNSDLKKPEYVNSYVTAAPCSAGMDVIVAISNTAGIGYSYGSTIKTTLATLSSHLATISGNNYRLGLVFYDWQFNCANSVYARIPTYLTATGYTSLPAAQKYLSGSTPSVYGGGVTYVIGCQIRVTAVTMMNTNNGAAFNTALSNWCTPVFPFGVQIDGATYPNSTLPGGKYASGAPVGEGLSRIVLNNIAGTWRNGVSRHLIIFSELNAAGNNGSPWTPITSVQQACQLQDVNMITYELSVTSAVSAY